jgi:hypothetical protein
VDLPPENKDEPPLCRTVVEVAADGGEGGCWWWQGRMGLVEVRGDMVCMVWQWRG